MVFLTNKRPKDAKSMSKNYFVLECLIVENDHYFVNVVILNKKIYSHP